MMERFSDGWRLAVDLGGVNDGSLAQTAEGDHPTPPMTTTQCLWLSGKTHQVGNTNSFWIHSPSAGSNERGFQAHTPWGNGTITLISLDVGAPGIDRWRTGSIKSMATFCFPAGRGWEHGDLG